MVGGDGNDELQLNASSRATVDMGAGNDRFTVTSLGQATVDAGDGNDRGVVFAANPAGSRVAGGLGDDGLAIGKGLAGVSTCGPGRDRMQSVREAVALDCERGDQVIPLPGRNGRSTVTFGRSLRSAVRVGPIAFSGRLRVYFAASLSAVRRRVPRIGLVELRVRRGQTVTARLRMSARERARLGSRRSLKGTLVAELRDAGHFWTSFDQFDTLRLPPR